MQLSPNFSYNEAVRSQTADRSPHISNVPESWQVSNMIYLANEYLEPFRSWIGTEIGEPRAIIVSSFFRSLALNRAIGSSDGSDHVKGLAVDFTVQGLTPLESFASMAAFLATKGLEYNQLLYEFGWVHLGVGPNKRHQMKWFNPAQ